MSIRTLLVRHLALNHRKNTIFTFKSSIPKRYIHKPLKCWQCGIERKNIGELFCEQCNYIQTPSERNNFFKMFGIDEKFDIDLKNLTKNFRKLQSQLHPDKFTNKSFEEKNISEDFSALVNKGYNTLQTPIKRAIHLLHLKGGKIEEGQKIDDPEFLMEIMELNEEVESADTPEKLKKLKEKNNQELGKIANDLKELFARNEISTAKTTIIKMKYYNSIKVHIDNLMREKGIVD